MQDKSYNKARTVKLDSEEDFNLQRHCERLGVDVSTFIRTAVNEKMSGNSVSHVAGHNVIEFDHKTDSFVWKIKLDSGEEKTILEHVPAEFLEDLQGRIKLRLHEREQLLKKTNKKSVPVPRRLMG
jgi:hypothetical protein